MKEKEEYYINYEGKLVDSLKLNLSTLNKHIAFIYIVCGLFTLYKLDLFKKISLIGNELNPNTVQFNLLILIVLIAPYLVINNSLRNILFITKQLRENSKKLLNENPNALSFNINHFKIYARGIIGVQFQVSNWVVKKYFYGDNLSIKKSFKLKKDPFSKFLIILSIPLFLFGFLTHYISTIVRFCIWVCFLCIIYIAPTLLVGFYITENIHITNIFMEIPKSTILFVILCFISIITLISNLKLLYYLYEKMQVLINNILKGKHKPLITVNSTKSKPTS